VGATPTPFHPQIRGVLITGREPLYFAARIVGGQGFDSKVFEEAPWPIDDKIVAEELGPYLAQFGRR
jgi:hypothetical protein